MKIVLATGIYPPHIGGIATYAEKLSEALRKAGHTVTVITYGEVKEGGVIGVSKKGSMFVRWKNYAKALRTHAADVDIVVALSSVSVGVPLFMAKLRKPKKILRLGGDFFWERYTDDGGTLGLAEWYRTMFGFWKVLNSMFMEAILQSFDSIIYSTELQQSIHERIYKLPPHQVLENALPASVITKHVKHTPFKVLSMSRHVGFKNLFALIDAMALLPEMQCTFIGSGPLEGKLKARATELGLTNRIQFRAPALGIEKDKVFADHDVLVIPSTTEISPNTGLEARAAGLPVLLTQETGLSSRLTTGMVLASLRMPEEIAAAIRDIAARYDDVARAASETPVKRDWSDVAADWITFLHTHT